MAFFVPFALGAAAAVVGLHVLKNKDRLLCKLECSCGCGDECTCAPDCDCACACNSSSVKKKAAKTADFALEKIKSGLQVLESNINESTLEKVKCGLQTAECKITSLQEKLKEEKEEKAN
ncbi:MAG: hypothetical protein LBC85_02445 [Fibromonadaceae bacterium]|jgi:hypothetical protein|nr:hypothetical protein [Fibromonadaceae bacterium]